MRAAPGAFRGMGHILRPGNSNGGRDGGESHPRQVPPQRRTQQFDAGAPCVLPSPPLPVVDAVRSTFMVLFTGQSGSGWLVSLLNQYEEVFMAEEVVAWFHSTAAQMQAFRAQYVKPLPAAHSRVDDTNGLVNVSWRPRGCTFPRGGGCGCLLWEVHAVWVVDVVTCMCFSRSTLAVCPLGVLLLLQRYHPGAPEDVLSGHNVDPDLVDIHKRQATVLGMKMKVKDFIDKGLVGPRFSEYWGRLEP